MKNSISFIAALTSLLLAFIFVYVFPNSGGETLIVGILGTVFSYFGIDWRLKYSEVKTWVKSKTIWGIALVFFPALAMFILPFFIDFDSINFYGHSLKDILVWVITAGGGTFIIGSSHAKIKKDGNNENQ